MTLNSGEKMKTSLVPPEYIRHIYPEIEKFLDRLVPVTNGRFERIDLVHDMLIQRENLWIITDDEEYIVGIVMTEIMYYPRKGYWLYSIVQETILMIGWIAHWKSLKIGLLTMIVKQWNLPEERGGLKN